MSWQSLFASFALIPVSLVGGTGVLYFVVACLLTSGFVFYSVRLALRRSNAAARKLLMASIIYLPMMFFLMALNRL
jgi:protoheme IX farnesyltransferase